MKYRTRRAFLGEVGQGMLLAGLGTTLATELGLAHGSEADLSTSLNFGHLEPLVALMQDTEPDKLMVDLVGRLKSGTELKTLLAAGALANARTFGGQDYIGFHTFMALAPAYRMSKELSGDQQPLPVLKVLHRNATRIQALGGRKAEVLYPVTADAIPDGTAPSEFLREATRSGDIERADRAFAALVHMPNGEAFNHLQFAVEDEVDVHRVVLAWRAWDTLELAGEEWAHCLLRQSIRYCADQERNMLDRNHPTSPIRTVLPALLDEYRLLERSTGQREGDNGWTRELADRIFRGTREDAAGAVAQALAEGFAPECIGEALSLAANSLVLHDPGRPEEWAQDGKPAGSCHGDSVGVHASDAANAWRNIARVGNRRNVVASLIVGAFHTAGQSARSNQDPYPFAEHLAGVTGETADALLSALDGAIREKDQLQAAAVVARYGQLGHAPRPIFDLMLQYATSEDGALHAEKYYHTVCAEFATTRPAYRWGQLVALARVTASEYGRPAPGYAEAKALLGV